MAVTCGLFVLDLLAQLGDLLAQLLNLAFHLLADGRFVLTSDGCAELFCLFVERSGFIVECFGLVPMRLGFGGGLRFELFEIEFPGLLSFHSVFETVGFLAPPIGDGLEFFDKEWLGLGVALHALRVPVLIEPDGISGFALGEEEQVGFDAGVGIEDAVGQADDGVEAALAH